MQWRGSPFPPHNPLWTFYLLFWKGDFQLRPRLIDPKIWGDERFAPLSIGAKTIYFGFICLSDDYGKINATKQELRMRLFPWGNYDFESMTKALAELLTVDLIVEYDTDHYFIPEWFVDQSMRFFARSKIYDVSDKILKRHPEYALASATARMKGKHDRKLKKVEESINRPLDGWTPETIVEAMELDSDLKADKAKAEMVTSLAQHYGVDLNASQIKDYLDVMERYSYRQCKDCMPVIRQRFGTAIPFPDKLEMQLRQMFGQGMSVESRGDISKVKGLFKTAMVGEIQVFLEEISEERRAVLMSWVWTYLAELADGEDNLPVLINDIYGDMDMKWERVQGIWEHMRSNVKPILKED